MSMDPHPTPWSVEHTHGPWRKNAAVLDATGHTVARHLAPSDAARIVAAVNSYSAAAHYSAMAAEAGIEPRG